MPHRRNVISAGARSIGLAALVLTGSIRSGAQAQSTLPVSSAGATRGEFGVSPTGQATYTVPLWTPPGTGSVEPNLALSYNSQRPGGLISPGWTLTGFSQITRCQKTMDQDGAVAPVYLTREDMFCMDGKRLRVTSGLATHAQPDSTYQTEIADFSLVTAVGAEGDGPAWFEVKLKNGLIYEYGNSVDSRAVLPGGTTPYAWALSKIRDRQGNNLTVTYTRSSGTLAPSRINYTQIPSISVDYPYAIVFRWASRDPSDKTTGYIAGTQYSIDSRLTSIDVRYGGETGSLLRTYRLDYTDSPTTQRARLAQVQECAGSDGTDCKLPTTISYQDGQVGVTAPNLDGGPMPGISPRRFADLNGDGRPDLLYGEGFPSNTRYWARFAVTGGFGPPIDTGIVATPDDDVLLDDFDGSGKIDVLAPLNGTWYLYRWNGPGFEFTGTSTGLQVDPNKLIATNPADGRYPSFASADVNGDGLPDLVWGATYNDTPAVYTRLNTTRGDSPAFAAEMVWAYPILALPYRFAGLFGNYSSYDPTGQRIDFNADGRDDVVLGHLRPNQIGITGQARQLISQGLTFATGPELSNHVGIPRVAKFNDDDCSDLMYRGQLHVSACNGTTGQVLTGMVGGLFLDWNGDGRKDVLGVVDDRWHVQLSRGLALDPEVDTNIPYTPQTVWFSIDQDADGLDDVAEFNNSTGAFFIGLHNGAGTPPDLVSSIADGLGNTFRPTFKTITQSNYTPINPESAVRSEYPTPEYREPLYVVSEFIFSDGSSVGYSNQFHYSYARVNRLGRGFLGFRLKRTVDSRDNLQRHEFFDQTFPYIGKLYAEQVFQPDGTKLVATTSRTLSSRFLDTTVYNSRKFVYEYIVSMSRYEMGGALDGMLLTQLTTNNSFDAWGTLYDQQTTIDEMRDGQYLNAQYKNRLLLTDVVNDPANWCLSKPSQLQQTRSSTFAATENLYQTTRTTGFSWDHSSCRLTQSVTEPGSPQWEVTTSYGYDAAGNVSATTVTPASNQGQSARTTLVDWGDSGRFPTKVTNAKSQVTTFDWDPVQAVRTSHTDPNNLTTRWQYDGFNRPTRVQAPEGTAVEYAWLWCGPENGFCNSDGERRTGVQATLRDIANTAMRTELTYFDSMDRVSHVEKPTLNGDVGIVTTRYNAFGRVSEQSAPHTPGEPVGNTRYSYDALARPTLIERPTSESDPSIHSTRFEYQGFAVTTTDAMSRSTTAWFDAFGRIAKMIDAANADTLYEYDGFDNLVLVRDVKRNELSMTYNERGLRTGTRDPDMGRWTYDYFPLGELRTQTNANEQTTQFTYDDLSRPLTRIELEGTTTWDWDSAPNGIGQLASVSATGDYAEFFGYDLYGRPAVHDIVIDGATYSYDYEYDADTGLLEAVTYPESIGDAFKIAYDYENGLVRRIKDFRTPTTVYWQANATNARNQIVHEQVGEALQTERTYDRVNGRIGRIETQFSGGSEQQQLAYTWDAVGNLLRRDDLGPSSLSEEFAYDTLDRLVSVHRNGEIAQSMTYDVLGNITFKSDVGEYTYHPQKKHAVVAAGENEYDYDANGNMIARTGSTITWTSYDLPQAIDEESGVSSSFFYGPARQRYKQIQTNALGDDPPSVKTTRFAGAAFEAVEIGETRTFRHYITTSDGRTVGVVARTDAGDQSFQSMTSDHLGSTDAIYPGSDSTPMNRFSYDAWGQRRDRDNVDPLRSAWTETQRGYTGHDHLDGQSLIHMNGRVYDPLIGRFLSADPIVQAPYRSQNLNRYSYALNNPLRYTDPSGYSLNDSIGLGFSIEFTGWIDFFGGTRHEFSTSCTAADTDPFCTAILANLDVLTECGFDAECRAKYPPRTTPAPPPAPTQPAPQPTVQPTLPGPDMGVGGLGNVAGAIDSSATGQGSSDPRASGRDPRARPSGPLFNGNAVMLPPRGSSKAQSEQVFDVNLEDGQSRLYVTVKNVDDSLTARFIYATKGTPTKLEIEVSVDGPNGTNSTYVFRDDIEPGGGFSGTPLPGSIAGPGTVRLRVRNTGPYTVAVIVQPIPQPESSGP